MIYSGLYRVPDQGHFGIRTILGRRDDHRGLDVIGMTDKHVCAVAAGVVGASTIITDKSNKTWEWGNYVRVDGDDGLKYYYCHLNQRYVSVGQRVEAGDHVGLEGWTGYVLPAGPGGSHCHFEIRDLWGNNVNPALVLGIPNEAGTYGRNYRAEAQERYGFNDSTMDYLDGHPYAADLYRKLAEK